MEQTTVSKYVKDMRKQYNLRKWSYPKNQE